MSEERELAQHEVGHPVHAAIHSTGSKVQEVIEALRAAGFHIVPGAAVTKPQEYPKHITGDDGVARIVHSREEEHQHKPPKAAPRAMAGSPLAKA